MNPFSKAMRAAHCELQRRRSVHDVPRLRRALHEISQIAEREDAVHRTHALHRIAQLARCALVVSTPPDDDGGPDTDHL